MEHFDHLVKCIISGQVPHEEIPKVFERNPGLKEYYIQVRGVNNMDEYTEYGYRGLSELNKAKEEIEELKKTVTELKAELKKAEELIQMHAMR